MTGYIETAEAVITSAVAEVFDDAETSVRFECGGDFGVIIRTGDATPARLSMLEERHFAVRGVCTCPAGRFEVSCRIPKSRVGDT